MQNGRKSQTGAARWRSIALSSLALLVLAAPSVWLLSSIPPLWRDVDAYIQTTSRPGPSTVLLHGPLYGFAARLPLYFGYLLEDSGAELKSFAQFFLRPTLTDSGVFTLLLLQHGALFAAQLCFVAALSKRAWIRLLLAVCLAANPLLYTFAHCVGSETLSAISVVLLTTIGWRIVRSDGTRARDWIAFGLVLVLLMLTRQINAVLVALLPLALLPLLAQNTGKGRWVPSPGARRLMLALGVGLAAVAISVGASRLIALAADVDYRSKIGFTFMWRLQFLQRLSPPERERVVRQAAAAARSAETEAVIEALGQMFASSERPNFTDFVRQQHRSLFPPDSEDVSERTDAALNGMPMAFALGSPSALIRAAAADFVTARGMRIPTVTEFLFWSTAYYAGREKAMPQLRDLATYRTFNADEVIATPARHSYLRWWNGITFDGWLVIWLAAFGVLVIVARRRGSVITRACSYSTALVLTGLLMMLLNCFLTELLPRYTVPMFELTLLSLVILLSRLAEITTTEPQRIPAT